MAGSYVAEQASFKSWSSGFFQTQRDPRQFPLLPITDLNPFNIGAFQLQLLLFRVPIVL